MAHTPLDELALTLNGNYIDRDGAPPDQPYQCHDVWLALLTDLLTLPVWLGWAPGYYGHTYEVWNQFPAVAGLDRHFTKHGGHAFQAGDVVFWPVSARYQGTHVVLALGPVDPVDGTFLCVTQNPGPATITRLSAEGAAGFLRPHAQWINQQPASAAIPPPVPEPRRKARTMFIVFYAHAAGRDKGRYLVVGAPRFRLLSSEANAKAIAAQLDIDWGDIIKCQNDAAFESFCLMAGK